MYGKMHCLIVLYKLEYVWKMHCLIVLYKIEYVWENALFNCII